MSSGGPSSQDRRVYVGNLAYNVKWAELKDFMRQGMCQFSLLNYSLFLTLFFLAGEVLNADVLTLPNGKSKGCGIVEYATPQEAKRAIEVLSNQSINGRSIFVREDRESENKAPATRFFGHDRRSGGGPGPAIGGDSPDATQVYVSNIPFSVTWKELKSLFQISGAVLHADVFQTQGRSKGTGVVLFESSIDAENAITKLNGYEFNGRPLEVRLDKFYKPGSSGFRSGGGSKFGRFGDVRSPNSFANYNGPVKGSPFTDGVTGHGAVNDTIYVSNLPWATTDQDLVELFQSVASVKRAEIQLEPSGRSAGAGVVQFDTPASAHIAIEKLNGYSYGNRPLTISFALYAGEPEVSSNGYPTAPSTASSAGPVPSEVPEALIPEASPVADAV